MGTRILLFTGKGGVGKTTCAAATALTAARQGYRTLILSTDPAHSLSDAFDKPLGPEPSSVVPNLDAQEVDLYYSMKKYWGNIRDLMLLMFKWQGIDEVAAEELAALPGMGEASAMLWLDLFFREGDYDLIVLDSAPTGETLTFLTLPQATEWWLTRAFPFQKLAFHTFGLAIRKTTGIPVDKGYDELRDLFDRLKAVHDIMSNPAITSVRLVLNPEKMVIREARRAFTYLQLYGYGVDAVIVNRIFPDAGPENIGWDKYLADQRTYLKEIDNSFEPLPRLLVPHQQREVMGIPLLITVGETLYGDDDPTRVFFSQPTLRVESDGGDYLLNLRLTLTEHAVLNVRRFGDELVVQVENQRHHYQLPSFLTYYHLVGSGYQDGWLIVRFEPGEDA